MLAWIWKWTICYWFHDYHKCYPEVWDRGLDGPWHCIECHTCGEELDIIENKSKRGG